MCLIISVVCSLLFKYTIVTVFGIFQSRFAATAAAAVPKAEPRIKKFKIYRYVSKVVHVKDIGVYIITDLSYIHSHKLLIA